MKRFNSKIDFFKYSPFLLLAFGIISIIFLKCIPVASGFGWDGVFYGKVALNFDQLIGNIDSYRAGRIFPGVLIHYVFRVLQIDLNLDNVLVGFKVYNVLILTLSGFLWVSISNHAFKNQFAKWFGFIALFINYPILNLTFYYPAQTDITAFFIAIFMIFSLIKRNNYLLLGLTSISFFAWPTMAIVGLICFVFSDTNTLYKSNANSKKFTFLWVVLLLSPLILGLLVNTYSLRSFMKIIIVNLNIDKMSVFDSIDFDSLFYNMYQFPSLIINLSVILFFFYLFFKNFDFKELVSVSFIKKHGIKLLISIAVLTTLILLKKIVEDPNLPPFFSLKAALMRITTLSLKYPFLFIVSHIMYFGPIIVLIILKSKNYLNDLKKDKLVWILVVIFMSYFILGVESRVLINFFPFLIYSFLKSFKLESVNHKKIFIISFVIISIIMSKVWLQFELPSSDFPVSISAENAGSFPLQWFFMNHGPWMNFEMYILHAFFALLLIGFYYYFVKWDKLSSTSV